MSLIRAKRLDQLDDMALERVCPASPIVFGVRGLADSGEYDVARISNRVERLFVAEREFRYVCADCLSHARQFVITG